MQLQQDELSLPARSLVPLLRGLKPPTDKARQAVERLLAWDFVLDRDSVPAAIYVAWEKAAEGRRLGADGPARSPLGVARQLAVDREDRSRG